MIVCPNCNHENPEEATLCETCYSPLPLQVKCPNCDSLILSSSTFCGQCGFNLLAENDVLDNVEETSGQPSRPEPLENQEESNPSLSNLEIMANENEESQRNLNEELDSNLEPINQNSDQEPNIDFDDVTFPLISQPESIGTELQIQRASLLHIQTDREIELPIDLSVIHIGKENSKVPPDIDISGFPDSQFVSRIHADIRLEDDAFYLEDMGSSNGTYVNHIPLPKGNRHRLRTGDRISLGKEDKVSFIFQITS
jgi:pSer/pThr/pTyr-binding forkhead associated (FHA) protein